MLEELKFRFTGVCPLLMHNSQLADPLNPYTQAMKEVSGKRNKTEQDYALMAKYEWYGALYVNEKKRVIIPASSIEAMVKEGAKKDKKGKQFLSSVFCFEDALLEYDGPKDIDKLYEDARFRDRRAVTVQRAKVMRTRPIFMDWSCDCTLVFRPDITDKKSVILAVEKGSYQAGLGDYRPRFGRFEAELI